MEFSQKQKDFELNNDMYEFYGVLMGDGCISKYINQNRVRYEIRIDGNSITDIDYYKYLINIIFKIINKRPKIYLRRHVNGIFIHFCNKNLALFLNKKLDFPIGKKKDIKIQETFLNNFNKLNHILRGIFDTDGSLYFTKNNSKKRFYPIIEITTYSNKLLNQLKIMLISQGLGLK